jgi:hypothetical protein
MHRISSHGIFARETRAVPENGQCVASDGAALGKEKLAAPYSPNNFRLNTRKLVESRMPLWDTVMIALVIGSTILFSIWAHIRATRADS